MIVNQNLDNKVKYTQFRLEDYDNDNNLNTEDVTKDTTNMCWSSDYEIVSVEVEEVSGSEDETNLGRGKRQEN